jgi:hypothetical protein
VVTVVRGLRARDASNVFEGASSMSRAFRVFPATHVINANDQSAVLFSTGMASIGWSIAEARQVALAIGRAADEAEYHLAMCERLRHERDDEPRYRSWESRAADEAAIPETGPL